MAQPALLNNNDHQQFRVITTRSAAYGDDVMAVPTFPGEFRRLQAHYPIVFQRTEQGFQPLALMGFEARQNLFLVEGAAGGWDAPCMPLALERQPFLIGRGRDELQVHIDLDSPRLSRTEGEPLFLPYGGHSDYLTHMTSVLLTLHEGLQATPAFVAALQDHGLLESFVFDIERADGTPQRLAGFHTVHEERLAALDAAALDSLHRAGWLLPIYMAVASLSQLRALADRLARLDSPGA